MIKVYRTRRKDIAVPLGDRGKMANKEKVDLCYSLHVNGASSTSARGYDTHAHPDSMKQTKEVQKIIQKRLGALFVKWGSKDRGTRLNNFQIFRDTKMSCVLTENGFMTNAEDMKLWKNPQFVDELAEAHAQAIREALKLIGGNSVHLDEGHGGKSFPGAVAKDGTREADLVLMLSDKIEAKLTAKEEPAPPKGDDEMAAYVTVKKGDSMYAIAKDNGKKLADLQKYNPHVEDPSLIHVGDIIFLSAPNQTEIDYATLKRKFVTMQTVDSELYEKQLADKDKEIKALSEDIELMRRSMKAVYNESKKYV